MLPAGEEIGDFKRKKRDVSHTDETSGASLIRLTIRILPTTVYVARDIAPCDLMMWSRS